MAVGWLAEQFHKRVDDAPIEITVSLLTPFVAYLAAERLGVSGVLAVVTAGLYLGWRIPEITSFRTRLQGGPVWEMVEFLLNGFVFILIGLQLPEVLRALSGNPIPIRQLVWYALLISLAVILIRILWVFPATYLPRLLFKKLPANTIPIPRGGTSRSSHGRACAESFRSRQHWRCRSRFKTARPFRAAI